MSVKKILIVDDSVTVCRAIKLALASDSQLKSESWSYHVEAVMDVQNAIQETVLFQPDVILMDSNLPYKPAFELKQELQQHPPLRHIPCILMVSAFEKLSGDLIKSSGFVSTIYKPLHPQNLKQVVAEVCARPVPPPPPREFLQKQAPLETPVKSDVEELTEKTFELSHGTSQALQDMALSPLPSDPPLEKAPLLQDRPLSKPVESEHSQEEDYVPAQATTFSKELQQSLYSMPFLEMDPDLDSELDELEESLQTSSQNIVLSGEYIESLVRQEVHQNLEKMTNQIVFEMAEKLIKEEIKKILTTANP